MFKIEKVKDLLHSCKLTQANLASEIGILRQNLNKILNTGSCSVESLEKIADYFKLPIDYFFERNVQVRYHDFFTSEEKKPDVNDEDCSFIIKSQAKEIEHLVILLEEKEKALYDKERTIQILMSKLK
ncbi:MAG: helix-turn-helix transcriptional regulator [Bacteroidales bacterium]|nr:helix-turn-helix transcriptional regulator [Bacteroidales bacterium]